MIELGLEGALGYFSMMGMIDSAFFYPYLHMVERRPKTAHVYTGGPVNLINVFELRNWLVANYGDFVRGFFHIQDARIRDQVEAELKAGLLWPEPLIQLNPSFEPGAWIDALVNKAHCMWHAWRKLSGEAATAPGCAGHRCLLAGGAWRVDL